MEFRNLTPFAALAYSAYDVHDEEHHVVVVKVLLGLEAGGDDGDTHRCALLVGDPRGELALTDAWEGEVNASSPRAECDLAPAKPRCDVTLRATARAPGGEPAARWTVALRVRDGDAVLLDKALTVCGPRVFERAAGRWSLTEPAAVAEVPLRWELAFGGRCVVPDPDAPPDAPARLLDEVCFTNPVGAGWIEARYLDALARARVEAPAWLPAPQVEHPDDPVTSLRVAEHPPHAVEAPEMEALAREYGHRPAGFGPVGRAWTPRLQRAGTYDDAWLASRHPLLPEDFRFAYWNAAPDDQQLPLTDRAMRVEVANVAAPGGAGGDVVRFTLPPHRAFVMAHVAGLPVPVPASVDTVHVDLDEGVVVVLWRALLSRAWCPSVLEARYETDPAAPLLRLEGSDPHG